MNQVLFVRSSLYFHSLMFILWNVFLSPDAAAQLSFYNNKTEHPFVIKEVHSDDEVRRIDSLSAAILKDTLKYTRRYSEINAMHYYYRHDTLVCAVQRFRPMEYQAKVEWVFDNGIAVCMNHTVRLNDGRYEIRNKYYFSKYKETYGGIGSLFAWKWFGKRINHACASFEKVNSSLPSQAKNVYEKGIGLMD